MPSRSDLILSSVEQKILTMTTWNKALIIIHNIDKVTTEEILIYLSSGNEQIKTKNIIVILNIFHY